MKKLDLLTGALVVVGGVNWGLVSVARLDLVAKLFGRRFGETSTPSRAVYGAVGAAALYRLGRATAAAKS